MSTVTWKPKSIISIAPNGMSISDLTVGNVNFINASGKKVKVNSRGRLSFTVPELETGITTVNSLVLKCPANQDQFPKTIKAVLSPTYLNNSTLMDALNDSGNAFPKGTITTYATSISFKNAAGTSSYANDTSWSEATVYFRFTNLSTQLKPGKTYYIYFHRTVSDLSSSSAIYRVDKDDMELTLDYTYTPSYTLDINWKINETPEYQNCTIATFSGWYGSTSASSNINGTAFSGVTDLEATAFKDRYYNIVATMSNSNYTCSNSPISGSYIQNESKYFEFWSKYTVVYNGNGSTSGSTASSNHRYGEVKNLTANGFSKTGYTFAGWNTRSDGTGTAYTDEAEVSNLTSTAGGTVTLYAQWSPNEYTLTFNANDGSSANIAVTVKYDSSDHYYLNSMYIPVRPGYAFLGYFTADSGGTQVYNASGLAVNSSGYWLVSGNTYKWQGTSDMNLYAHWEVMSQTYINTANGFSLVQPQIFKNGSWHAAQTHRWRNGSWEFS